MNIVERSLELELPKVPKYCVYIFLDHKSIIYIGTTQKGMAGIFSNKYFNDNVNKVLLVTAKNEIHMLQIQNDMIIKYRPIKNICLNKLAHRVSTLKHDLEPIYYFNKNAVKDLIDNSGVDVIHIGNTDYLNDEDYYTLFTYASDTVIDKNISKDLSPNMRDILDIMINNGGALYKAKHNSIWFYDLETWNNLCDDYNKKVEWAKDYDIEFFIYHKDALNNLESQIEFCMPEKFWYTLGITSQLKALSNRNLVSLNLSEGICTLKSKE